MDVRMQEETQRTGKDGEDFGKAERHREKPREGREAERDDLGSERSEFDPRCSPFIKGNKNGHGLSWAWRFMPVIPALGRWRQKDCEFKTSLCYIVRPSLKQQKNKQRMVVDLKNC
jgi:hypothetical protein